MLSNNRVLVSIADREPSRISGCHPNIDTTPTLR